MVALGGYEVYLKNRSQTCQGAEIFAFPTFGSVQKVGNCFFAPVWMKILMHVD